MKTLVTEKTKESNEAFSLLQEKNMLRPGNTISGKMLEEIFKCKYHPDSWEFRAKYLTLKGIVESEGFFITQKGLDAPSFRILRTDEMADFAHKKLTKYCMGTFKTGYILAAHSHKDQVSEEEQKKILHMQKTAARMAIAQQTELMKNFIV